ncbi:MAG: hypothetical protein R3F13_09575 [Prosthecobacter sp.]
MKRVVPFSLLLTCVGVVSICFQAGVDRVSLTSSRKLMVFVVTQDLRIALESYRIEYGHFPGQPIQDQASDVRVTTVGPLVDCLMGETTDWNPKGIKFIDIPDARGGKFGYLPAAGDNPSQVVDLWGQPYIILLDTDGDERIRNPDITNADPAVSRSSISPPPEFLPVRVAVVGLGRDKIEGTGDDVVSWRPSFASEPSASWLDWPWIVLSVLVLVGGFVIFLSWLIGFREAKSPRPDSKPVAH